MDKAYLQELISQAKARGGGLVINQNDRPAVVVMTVDKYNEVISNNKFPMPQAQTTSEDFHSHNNRKILVTGGAGYIGSHTCRELLKAGYAVVVLDNLSTGKKQNIPAEAKFIEGDTADKNLLLKIFNEEEKIYAVLHFAASIEVEESVREPEKYLQNNAINTSNLLAAMAESNVKHFIFSSTAAVYGDQAVVPIPETAKAKPNNPYGYAKFVAEKLIKYHAQFMGLKAVIFRYSNACGCDFDGAIADPHMSHLIPFMMEVFAGKRPDLKIYGNDYNTPDHTCVRDYVHVLDIARAHVVALDKIAGIETFEVYNIGTGSGQSVLQVVHAAEQILDKKITLEFMPRRPGDAAITVADNHKITTDWDFKPEFSDLETIIKTTWRQMYH